MVDCVQTDSPGSDERADSLQLTMSYVVLENDVVGEVDIAGGFESFRRGAGLWYLTLCGASLDSHV